MLEIDRLTVDGAIVLTVNGEVDIANKRVMHGALETALELAKTALIVDLSGVRFMDSTGLALLLNAARRVERRRLGFAVACPPGPVRRAFSICGLDEAVTIETRVDDAVARAQPAFWG